MALKDWKNTPRPNRLFESINDKKDLWVWVDTSWNGLKKDNDFIVGLKNKNPTYFTTKSKAMKFAMDYMKKH